VDWSQEAGSGGELGLFIMKRGADLRRLMNEVERVTRRGGLERVERVGRKARVGREPYC